MWKPPKGAYEALVEMLGEVCGVCGNPPRKRRLHIDHDHKTGLVRGLLCYYDNKFVIGRHTLERLRKAVAYLERHEREVQKQTKKRRYNPRRAHSSGSKAPSTGGESSG